MIPQSARPIIAILGYTTLCILAIVTAAGVAIGMPDWYLGAFIGGTMTYILGWSGVREYWKRKGEYDGRR